MSEERGKERGGGSMNPTRWEPIALYIYKYGAPDKNDFYPAYHYTWDIHLDGYIEVRSLDGKERYEYFGMPAKVVYAAKESDEHED
jgi:hypothetical protein